MIHVEEETKVWVIIGGVDFKEYGDAYDFVVLAKAEQDSIYFFRMAGKFTKDDFNAITKYFNSLGYTKGHWIRIKKGKVKKVKIRG